MHNTRKIPTERGYAVRNSARATISRATGNIKSICSECGGNATLSRRSISQQTVETLVDTGAAVAILHQDLFNWVRMRNDTLRKTHQPILGTVNKHLSVCGVTELSINIGDIEINTPYIYVCDNLAHELLLGADFLKQNTCVVNLCTVTIKVKSCPMIWKTTRAVFRVAVAASRTIPTYSMVNGRCNPRLFYPRSFLTEGKTLVRSGHPDSGC